MDWKMKLALAMGAFVSMPVASVANACSNELTARRRMRRRRISVPARVVPGTDQSLRVNVSLPSNEARRVPAACNAYRVKATLTEIKKSDLGEIIPKVEIEQVNVSDGAILEFDLNQIFQDNGIFDPITVNARVEVTPTDAGSCATIKPITSFVLQGETSRTFLPSQALNPVHLRPLSLGGPIIIKDPKNNN